jgi:hypothetical protein
MEATVSRFLKRVPLIVVVCLSGLGLATPATAQFNNASVQGVYVGALDGALALSFPDYLPTWSTVRLVANGRGAVQQATATFNIGGCIIIRLSGGTGRYTVRPSGTGTATVTFQQARPVNTDACFGFPDLGIGPPFEFRFEFVTNLPRSGVDQVLDGIALTFSGMTAGGVVPVATGSQGAIRSQQR